MTDETKAVPCSEAEPRLITFKVLGVAVPKGRPRFAAGHAYTPTRTRRYEAIVRQCAKKVMNGAEPLKGALACSICVRIEPPQSKRKELEERGGCAWHTKKPDLDNLVKALLDGMNGIAFEDDSQICEMSLQKLYTLQPAQVLITLRRLNDE
jgi:Holliday junction resolvase RusA-like endonuclease